MSKNKEEVELSDGLGAFILDPSHTIMRRIAGLINQRYLLPPMFVPVILAMLLSTATHAAEWTIDTGAKLLYESNVNHAAFNEDILDDFAFAPHLSIGKYFQLTDNDGLSVAAVGKGAVYWQYEGLNNVFGGGTFSLKHKFELGAYAPWVRLYGSAGYMEYESDIRDSGLYLAGFQIGKRFHPRFDLQIGYAFDYRAGPSSKPIIPGKPLAPGMPVLTGVPANIYTLAGHQLSMTSNFLLTDAANLSLGYLARFGDITSNCTGRNVGRVINAVDAVTREDTFDGCTYRINSATTHVFSVETGYALTGHSSINLRYEYHTASGSGLSYSNHVPQLSFNHSF